MVPLYTNALSLSDCVCVSFFLFLFLSPTNSFCRWLWGRPDRVVCMFVVCLFVVWWLSWSVVTWSWFRWCKTSRGTSSLSKPPKKNAFARSEMQVRLVRRFPFWPLTLAPTPYRILLQTWSLTWPSLSLVYEEPSKYSLIMKKDLTSKRPTACS